jgi:membrane fusion protein (multidrug efflux system)
MLVTATVPREAHANAIVVPRSAVAQTENGFAVYVVGADNKAQQVPVRVGVQTDTLSEVVSPKVRVGTKVITTRPDTLKDGSTVAINSPSANGGSTSQ